MVPFRADEIATVLADEFPIEAPDQLQANQQALSYSRTRDHDRKSECSHPLGLLVIVPLPSDIMVGASHVNAIQEEYEIGSNRQRLVAEYSRQPKRAQLPTWPEHPSSQEAVTTRCIILPWIYAKLVPKSSYLSL